MRRHRVACGVECSVRSGTGVFSWPSFRVPTMECSSGCHPATSSTLPREMRNTPTHRRISQPWQLGWKGSGLHKPALRHDPDRVEFVFSVAILWSAIRRPDYLFSFDEYTHGTFERHPEAPARAGVLRRAWREDGRVRNCPSRVRGHPLRPARDRKRLICGTFLRCAAWHAGCTQCIVGVRESAAAPVKRATRDLRIHGGRECLAITSTLPCGA
jgi:hypothetical protein